MAKYDAQRLLPSTDTSDDYRAVHCDLEPPTALGLCRSLLPSVLKTSSSRPTDRLAASAMVGSQDQDTRQRTSKTSLPNRGDQPASTASFHATSSSSAPTMARNPPFLPTPLEAAALLVYPIILTFGTLFSLLSPTVRNAPYFPSMQAHSQDPLLSPSYFARKSNVFNVYFVKRGWAWVSLAFFVFIFTHPAVRAGQQKTRALVRWGLVTTWWVFVTQWCFGPALIDRSFLFTGGKCELAEARLEAGTDVSGKDIFTAVACKTAGGNWRGGHDISGHVFLLVLGSYFLLQEVGWVYLNHWRRGAAGGVVGLRDERSVIMHDGAVKSASVEGERDHSDAGERTRPRSPWDALALGGKVAGGVFLLSLWMILMTAIFFHTWIEKVCCDPIPPCAILAN